MQEGITEEISAFGHRYQIQTEAVGADGRVLRTSVFDSGAVVAIREATAPPEADLRTALDEHHRRVVAGLRERTEPGDGSEERASTPRERREDARAARTETREIDLPPVPEEPGLVDGLRVRQLYGDLRERLDRAGRRPEGERLAAAEGTLRWIVAHPLFPKIRLDEQLRFHRLLDRVASPEDGDPTERWKEVEDFAGYLNLINHRADLRDYDRQLLEWLAVSIEARGVDPSTLTPMRWIFGRDDALDRLLEEVATTDREVWLCEIRRVRAGLDG